MSNRKLRRKSTSMVATSLLATSALLGTYLGNPRLGRAYATGVCTAATETEFKDKIAESGCTTIDITESFTAISAATIASGDKRTSLIINGVGNGITINGGVTTEFRLLDNKEAGLSLTISNLTIRNFKFAGDGGAIFSAGAVTVTNSTFSGNEAGVAGGAIFSAGAVTVTNSTFSGNEAGDAGGAIYSAGAVTVTNSTFSGNEAVLNGGGAIRSDGNVTVTNSTFSGNKATSGDGGGFRSSGTATVTNSTFSGNTTNHASLSFGGGFFSNGGATVTNSTFSENSVSSALGSGGGFYSFGTATVTNSIFTGNTANTAKGFFYKSAATLSHSIFNTYDTVNAGPATGTGVIVGNPLLGALQNNGGSTLTMLPGAGSPAIDSGSNDAAAGLDFDQRGTGFARIANGTVDMGAVEVQVASSSGASGGWDGVGVQSLTTVLLQDQSGLDRIWSDHDILLQALKAVLAENPDSELKVLADGSVRLTAFIPTDRAFRKLAFDLTGVRPRNDRATFRVVNSLGIEKIEQILLYHVVLGDPIDSEAALAANGVRLNTLSGDSFSLRVTKAPNIFLRDNNKDLKNPKVLLKRVDINSGNRQVAHVINRVLIPIEDLK